MDRRTFLQRAAAVGLVAATPSWWRALAAEIQPAEVRGHVVSGNEPLPGVRVSDGFRVTRTDSSGEFRLPVGPDSGPFVFVTVPQGFWADRFYQPTVMAAAKSPVFALNKRRSDNAYQALYLTDIHLGDGRADQSFSRFEATIDEINDMDPLPAFCWMGGDISLQRGEGKRYVELISRLKMPVRNGVGNHEMLMQQSDPRGEFQELFGPTYYAFDVGNVHYITLDGCQVDSQRDQQVLGEVSARERHWLAEDLKNVPDGMATVVAIHIPLVSDYPERRDTTARKSPHWIIQNAGDVIDLLSRHGVSLVLQGHLHENQRIVRKGIEFVESVSVCGTWWKATSEEREVGVSGEPRGYRVLDVRGDRISHRYRGSAESRSDAVGEIVGQPRRVSAEDNLALEVNIFDASEQAEVWARVDDAPPVVLQRSGEHKHFANLAPAHHWKLAIPAKLMRAGRHRLQIEVKEPGQASESFDHVILAS